ncbi:molecular chaperone [Volvox carteri f. nagariensis]|uniref:Molecular chaperone n=1 Tax=Volvox carteri f. nagariensis TaxID=3068 RepID=D8TNH9_VOLCA|nr:molecular chaperone [Volvox carteri f. nagariensis]EFJ50842.1 molecular chaperone [Volvox carteri f. nagariensis]|eukprot:XP_002947854.1 molecular chaperone [Volvox carteri f. nagariensis]
MEPELTHYQVLGIHPSATLEQIKQAYHAAVLKYHPDKAVSGTVLPTTVPDVRQSGANTDAFQLVKQAWEVLRDAGQRAAYDGLLSLKEMQSAIAYQDELDLLDMDVEDRHEGVRLFTHPCRCGDVYALSETELAGRDSLVVPCRTCSNHVLVRASGT